MKSLFNKELPDDFYVDNIRPQTFLGPLQNLNWKIFDSGYLDIPPWPDIAMKKEDMLKMAGLGFLMKKREESVDENPGTCIVDYFNGRKPEMEKEILKYSFLENSPFPVKQLWGHHRYFIFAKE